ncbi:MAG: hypothetical protein K9M56_06810 [Victivallales bacterium]|nr:hypothetical protein [Victivallales bacterium]
MALYSDKPVTNVNNILPTYILSCYKDDFIYIDGNSLSYNPEVLQLSGKFVYKNPHYAKMEQSTIFNNTEAVLLNNQAMYILTTCYWLTKDGFDLNDITREQCKKYFRKLGNIVFKKQNLIFNKSIYSTERKFCFKINFTKVYNRSKWNIFKLRCVIGENSNMVIESDMFILPYDTHGIHQ